MESVNPHWYDLAESYGNIKGIEPNATLDFRTNPRWNGKTHYPSLNEHSPMRLNICQPQ